MPVDYHYVDHKAKYDDESVADNFAARLKFVNFMRARMWGGRPLDLKIARWTEEDVRHEVVRLLKEYPQHHAKAKELGVPEVCDTLPTKSPDDDDR